MKGILNIQSQNEYQAWVDSQAPKKPKKEAPVESESPATTPEVEPTADEAAAVAISSALRS